jgi:[ribosomal protein S5]-alanine N-acetyltransferase
MIPARFDDVVLRTPRLLLRPVGVGDEEAMFRIFSDPDVMRYWSWLPWTSMDEARSFVTREIAAMTAGEYVRWVVVRAADDVSIGMTTLFSISGQSRRAEIGYALERAAWGQGLMHEALLEVLRYAFEDLDLHRIEADIDPRNTASARSLERLGFVREGLLRDRWIVGDEISDSALYGLLRLDWERRRADAR